MNLDDPSHIASWEALSSSQSTQRWYTENYRDNAYGGAAGRVQRLMHRSLERGYSSTTHFGQVLEVGGNVGEHVPFVRHGRDRYLLSDLIDRRPAPLKAQHDREGIEFTSANVTQLPWDSGSFDRVVNTCLLHHVSDPEVALEEMRRVLKVGGIADIFITGDPGMAFRAARYLGPARRARAQGLGDVKSLIDAREHVNHVGSLLRLTTHVFRNDRVAPRSYPLNLPGWNASLWHVFRVAKHGSHRPANPLSPQVF